MSQNLSENSSPVEKFHILDGCFSFACLNPKEQYVYNDSEIKSSKIQRYIKTHRWDNSSYYKISVESFELKKWTIDNVLNQNKSCNPTSVHYLLKNGFKIEAEIDLVNLFDNGKNRMKKLEAQGIHNGELHTELKSHIPYNLSEKRREIQQILTSINYENRNLLILRIYKGSWFLYYDQIYIFSKNNYNSKRINRLKINLRIIKTKLNRWRIKTRIYLHKRLFHK
mgnify:CR=1 FL=1